MPITKQSSRVSTSRAALGDRLGAEDRERRLDHGPDPRALGRAEAAQAQADRDQRVGRRHLGDQDRVRAGRRGGGEVRLAPGRVEGVDADREFAAAIAAARHGGADLLPRRVLGLGRDGVLEVEDQRVGRERFAFSRARAFEPGM